MPEAPPFLAAGLSRVGRRASNEDSLAVALLPGSTVCAWAVVCDGMGGHSAGEVASALAVKVVRDRIASVVSGRAPVRIPADLPALEAEIARWISDANGEIRARGAANIEQRGMGTTLALALVVGEGRLLIANVGDSKIFLVSGVQVRQISVDHTAIAEQRRVFGADSVAPSEDAGNPFAHALTRSLGQEQDVAPDVRSDLEMKPGDAVILTSDGVTDVLESERFLTAIETSSSIEAAAEEIYRLAYEAGSKDNISVAILSYGTPARLGRSISSVRVLSAESLTDATVPLGVVVPRRPSGVEKPGSLPVPRSEPPPPAAVPAPARSKAPPPRSLVPLAAGAAVLLVILTAIVILAIRPRKDAPAPPERAPTAVVASRETPASSVRRPTAPPARASVIPPTVAPTPRLLEAAPRPDPEVVRPKATAPPAPIQPTRTVAPPTIVRIPTPPAAEPTRPPEPPPAPTPVPARPTVALAPTRVEVPPQPAPVRDPTRSVAESRFAGEAYVKLLGGKYRFHFLFDDELQKVDEIVKGAAIRVNGQAATKANREVAHTLRCSTSGRWLICNLAPEATDFHPAGRLQRYLEGRDRVTITFTLPRSERSMSVPCDVKE